MEEVDDINVHLEGGNTLYIQAKAVLSFSLSENGGLRSVLDQFCRQTRQPGDRLLLVTTSRSPKKITHDFRAALDAYRGADDRAFYKTQPKSLTGIIDDLKATLATLSVAGEAVGDILRAMTVTILDVDDSDPLEQAIVLMLQACGYIAPQAVWGKLVSDCVTFAKSRRTISIAEMRENYSRFLISGPASNPEVTSRVIELVTEGGLASAREILLCESEGGIGPFPDGMCVIELYRFDDDCKERIRIEDDDVVFGSGARVKLLARASTFEGMNRLLKREDVRLKDRDLTFMMANLPDDLEDSSCAKLQRERIKTAIATNKAPLTCLHCGRSVFSADAHVVELLPADAPVVGLVHDECLLPADRVLGMVKHELFNTHAELVDFDIEGWFKAIRGGQIAFAGADYLAGSRGMVMAWNGDGDDNPPGDHMVEISLLNGGREFVTRRNAVHRFSRPEAESFARELNSVFSESREAGDPFCYSDQSKAFGPKSEILDLIGVKEVLLPVNHARVRPYDANFAKRFSRPGHWYAPILYLRGAPSGEPISLDGATVLITDPLSLKAHLDNWREAGFDIGMYRTEVLLDDNAFDTFMRRNEERGNVAVVNPLFAPAQKKLISGRLIMSPGRLPPHAAND